jgi:hypothetical protein
MQGVARCERHLGVCTGNRLLWSTRCASQCAVESSGSNSSTDMWRMCAGKGVSSSAALEVSVMAAVAAAHGINLGGREVALLCQKVEVGRKCWRLCAVGRPGPCCFLCFWGGSFAVHCSHLCTGALLPYLTQQAGSICQLASRTNSTQCSRGCW